jgi:hypothetical protein
VRLGVGVVLWSRLDIRLLTEQEIRSWIFERWESVDEDRPALNVLI